jgi:hypothetical protein
MEQRWYKPLKKFPKPLPRPLENNSIVMFEARRTDEEPDEEEISGVPAADPMALFHDRSWYKPPRPSTPVCFHSIETEYDDQRTFEDGVPKIRHQIAAGPHNVSLILRKDASPERILEVLRRRTGISGGWKVVITNEGNVKDNTPRQVLLIPMTEIAVPSGIPTEMKEVRVFFGTLERKSIVPINATPEESMRQLAAEAKLDDRWRVERSLEGTYKSPPIVIATRDEEPEPRQALPAGLTFFVADHVEQGRFVNQHRIQCKGEESPDQQASLVSQAFGNRMKITEWVEEADEIIHLQCSRLGFVTIRFVLKDKTIDSWMQVRATTKQKEKLASVLFEQRVKQSRLGVDDEGAKTHEMVPFSQRYIKPRDERICTRQMTFPGAPPPDRRSRPPVELRKRYGGLDYRQIRIVEDVISGQKLTLTYDPTQRTTQVDPDIEAELTGADRTVPGDTFVRTITWVWPDGTTTLINKFDLPVGATPQDLMWRLCKILKIPELKYQYTTITPENWRYSKAI